MHTNRFGKPAYIRAAYCKTKDGYLARAAVQYDGESFKNDQRNAFSEVSVVEAIEQAISSVEAWYRRDGIEPPARKSEKPAKVSHFLLVRDSW
jgi:hypothetical protein